MIATRLREKEKKREEEERGGREEEERGGREEGERRKRAMCARVNIKNCDKSRKAKRQTRRYSAKKKRKK